MRKPNIKHSLLLGTSIATFAWAASPALAQNNNGSGNETVIVTGTRVQGMTAADSAAPITVLGSDALTKANRQLEILATRDPLTGLGNRRSATDLIARLWHDPTVPKASIAFIMADIDFFKRLNDSVGHAAGDECIRRVAETIADQVRHGEDAVFRYGGEEFLIVLASASPDLAWDIAQRIRRAVETLAIPNPGIRPADGAAGRITISLGIAFAQDDAPPETVAKWADDALYDAKRSGRNAVFLANPHAVADGTEAARPATARA